MTTDQGCLEEQNSCKDIQLPRGFLCAGGDGGSRTSLLAAAQGPAGEMAVLRMVGRDGRSVGCWGNSRQDLKKGEVILNSPSQLTNDILWH